MNKPYEATEFLRLAKSLQGLTSSAAQAEILELIAAARSIGVPTTVRRDDAPVFLAGTERIETATWTQCGGILYAVAHHDALDPAAVAARVAARIAELAPARRV